MKQLYFLYSYTSQRIFCFIFITRLMKIQFFKGKLFEKPFSLEKSIYCYLPQIFELLSTGLT